MAGEPRGIRSKPNTLEHLSLVNCLTGLDACRREGERGRERMRGMERQRDREKEVARAKRQESSNCTRGSEEENYAVGRG